MEQDRTEDYSVFLSDIARQVESLISENRDRFIQQTKEFENRFYRWQEAFIKAHQDAKEKWYLKYHAHISRSPKIPTDYVFYEVNKVFYDSPDRNDAFSFYGPKIALNPIDTLRKRDMFEIVFPSTDGEISARKPSDKIEDLLRKYYLLAVIHSHKGYGVSVIDNPDITSLKDTGNLPAGYVWQAYADDADVHHESQKRILINTALDSVRNDLAAILNKQRDSTAKAALVEGKIYPVLNKNQDQLENKTAHKQAIEKAGFQVYQWTLDDRKKAKLTAMAKKIGDDEKKMPAIWFGEGEPPKNGRQWVDRIEIRPNDAPVSHCVEYLFSKKQPTTEAEQVEADYLLLLACYAAWTEKDGQGRINPFIEHWPESLLLMLQGVLKPFYGDRTLQIKAALLNVEQDLTPGKEAGEIETPYIAIDAAKRSITIGNKIHHITNNTHWSFIQLLISNQKQDKLTPRYDGSTDYKNVVDALRRKMTADDLNRTIAGGKNGYRLHPNVTILNFGQIGIRRTKQRRAT